MPIRREPHITREMVEAEALRLWREREMSFPERVRRMTPDSMDVASGAWAGMCTRAFDRLSDPLSQSEEGS